MTDREKAERIVDQFPGPLPAHRDWWVDRVAKLLQRAEAAEARHEKLKSTHIEKVEAIRVEYLGKTLAAIERAEKAERERDAMKSELDAAKEALKSARKVRPW